MPQITDSTVVGGPVGEVWALLRDFAAIGDWHRRCRRPRSRMGRVNRVGSVRVFPLTAGHRETLTGLDDQRRRIAFTVRRPRGRTARPLLHLHDHRPSGHRERSDLRRVVVAVRLRRGRRGQGDRRHPRRRAGPRAEGARAAVRTRTVCAVTTRGLQPFRPRGPGAPPGCRAQPWPKAGGVPSSSIPNARFQSPAPGTRRIAVGEVPDREGC